MLLQLPNLYENKNMRLPKKQTSRFTYTFRPGYDCVLPAMNLDDTLKGFSASPQGGNSEMVRAINATGRPSYRRQSGKPDYSITFTVDEVEMGRRIDWQFLDSTRMSFYLDEHDNLFMYHTTYAECQVESVSTTTDANGNKELSVTISAFSSENW